MDIKLARFQQLNEMQKQEIEKAFNFIATNADGGRARKRAGEALIVPKADVPRLLRACGRAPTPEELQHLINEVPDKGVTLQEFFKLFEMACQYQRLDESQLFDCLKTLDLTGSGSLDPKAIKEILMSIGDRLSVADIDKVLQDLPTDGLGRISCRLIARKLVKGPEQIPHL
eukprot:TRINITY_DN9271_c0_g1_i1.p1 TRINITY_DN9271_c0_g1~~TRINITY_DN9271_c0_g1_i1.p1  ORF type:complete len:172 (+),score=35.06 TRINITY_DN9271_c0_g1_i1:105-620(+)